MTSLGRAVSLAALIGLTACGGADGGGEGSSSGGEDSRAARAGGGRPSLPQWRLDMAQNTRINLSLNTQASVDPELNPALNPNYPSNAPWRGNTAYAGAFAYGNLQYAEQLGKYGSIVGTIGGHNGYWGNEVVRFDIETRQFAHLSDPYSSNSHPGSFFVKENHGHCDRNQGELFIDALFNTDQTQPCSFHAYSSNVVLPPDSETGVGAKGGLITPVRAARYLNGVDSGNHSHRTHIFDLAQANRATAAWARYATNLYENGADRFSMGWAAYDTSRKKVFTGIRHNHTPGYNVLNVLNCVTRQWETPLTLSANVWQWSPGMAWHWKANPDYLIIFSASYNSPSERVLQIVHIPTGQVSAPGTGAGGPSLAGGSEFVQSVNKIAHYEGGAGGQRDRVWILTPPSTTDAAVFTTTPWTWSFEDVAGPTPPAQTAGTIPHIGRFVWAEKVKSFIWWANGVDNVQAWRVKGFD